MQRTCIDDNKIVKARLMTIRHVPYSMRALIVYYNYNERRKWQWKIERTCIDYKKCKRQNIDPTAVAYSMRASIAMKNTKNLYRLQKNVKARLLIHQPYPIPWEFVSPTHHADHTAVVRPHLGQSHVRVFRAREHQHLSWIVKQGRIQVGLIDCFKQG